MRFATQPAMPMIARAGHQIVVRLDHGAVILDSHRRRLIEVTEEAASTLDLLLFDRVARLPASEIEAARMRKTFRALRGALFVEAPGEPDVELEKEEALLRCHDEPAHWRRPMSLPQPRDGGALLTLGVVRRDGGVVAFAGARSVVASVTGAFPDRGLSPGEVVVLGGDDVILRTTAREELRPVELWTLDVGNRPGLMLTRLSPARSFVKLFLAARMRPSERALAALASCAERVPHFVAVLPRDLPSRTRAVTEYLRSAIP